MDKNLFEQAKDMMMNFGSGKQNQQGHSNNEEDKQAIRNAIQAAYNEATPEEKNELQQFEQQLDEKIDLH